MLTWTYDLLNRTCEDGNKNMCNCLGSHESSIYVIVQPIKIFCVSFLVALGIMCIVCVAAQAIVDFIVED